MEQVVLELLFADDCALIAHTEEALQRTVNSFANAASAFGLTISLKKTEVLYQPPPGTPYCEPHISINNTELNAVEHFTYLGSVMSNDATTNKDVDNHLSKASSSFGHLAKRVWQDHSLRLSTKLKVYQAVVIPTLLYGSETWTLYKRQLRILERFHQRCLRTILNIKWQDYISNEEVLIKAHLPSIEALILKHQLCWVGHVTRMETVRLPKAVFFGELTNGKRGRGAPRKRYKDQLKKQLSLAGINHQYWQQEASNREGWHHQIYNGWQKFEHDRRMTAENKRKRRKERTETQTPVAQGYPCPKCGKICAARIGLHSHMKACRRVHPPQSSQARN